MLELQRFFHEYVWPVNYFIILIVVFIDSINFILYKYFV